MTRNLLALAFNNRLRAKDTVLATAGKYIIRFFSERHREV
jgi:hypothetical protein